MKVIWICNNSLQKLKTKKKTVFSQSKLIGSLYSTGHMMQSYRCNYSDATFAKHEGFFLSIEKDDSIKPDSHHQESLDQHALLRHPH